jgi:hypothetical protein
LGWKCEDYYGAFKPSEKKDALPPSHESCLRFIGKPNLIPGAYAPGIYKTYFQNIKNLVKKFSI